MKSLLAAFCLLTLSSSVFAAASVGAAPGLADSGLKQYTCSMEVQEMNPKTGNLGQPGSTARIVVATDANEAKAAALNKLEFYGPVEGALFYMTEDRRQFKLTGISCN